MAGAVAARIREVGVDIVLGHPYRNALKIRPQLQLRPDLQSVPVWVTENNVNADFANPSGDSSCHPTQKFVPDLREIGRASCRERVEISGVGVTLKRNRG